MATRKGLLVDRALKGAQLGVATALEVHQRLGGGLAALQRALDFFVVDVADFGPAAKAVALGELALARFDEREDGHVAARVLGEEPRLLHGAEGAVGGGQEAGGARPFGHHAVGAQKVEEHGQIGRASCRERV